MTRRIITAVVAALVASGCSGCRGESAVLLTDEGVTRKVVLRADSTAMYWTRDMSQPARWGKQWQIFFITNVADDYYRVSPSEMLADSALWYVRRTDAFEWNTFFCIAFKNSPDQARRQPIATYRTEEGARRAAGDTVMIEKLSHAVRMTPQPMLRQTSDGIMYVAALYDDVDSAGNYVFLGHYNFGFVRFDSVNHIVMRYVSREHLDQHVRLLLGAQLKQGEEPDPIGLFASLRELFADYPDDVGQGINDILSLFNSGTAPSAVETGLFSQRHLAGDTLGLHVELFNTTQRMIIHLRNPAGWNNEGYSFIPTEWVASNGGS